MVFSSSLFLLYFLPFFLLAYHAVNKELKNYVILIASIFFYSWGAPKFVFIILTSTIIDFYIVRNLHKSTSQKRRKLFLSLSIFVNLGLLVYFKYANFFVDNLSSFLYNLGFERIKWVSVALPIGISFYTFQTLTYSIDVFRRVHAPLEKLTDYLLYIMSFPQMIAGPIVRFNTIADEITGRRESIDDKLVGFYRFSIGLAKKVLIANVMAEQADLIFDNSYNDLSMANAWLGVIAYTFQIYFDFSGYSDMAIGLGKMMGFHFPENFNSPYVATSITEFWRRWHITLGSFMRDYLYIPLGGNRVSSKFRLYINLAIVFLLSGLWHGAAWNFILWGAYHGLFLILDRLFLLKFLKRIGKLSATLVTFLIVVISWVIFRIEDFNQIGLYFRKLFSFDSSFSFNTTTAFSFVFVLAVLFSFLVSFRWGRKIEAYIYQKERYNVREYVLLSIISIILFVMSLSSITSSGFNPFIYFRF